MLVSGCTSYITGSKELMTKLSTNINHATVTYGDKPKSKLSGLGKVVVAPDITLVNAILLECLGYNLMSVRSLNKMGFEVHFALNKLAFKRASFSIFDL